MRKAALLLGICIGIFSCPFMVTDIDGEKPVVVQIDTSRSLRAAPDVTPLPIVLVID
jgi:hypothetical protein